MTGYPNEKRKTLGNYFWWLCLQVAGAISVFFMILSLFQTTAPEMIPLQQAVRASFTSDTDITPVIEWLEDTNTNTDALQASAPGY